MDTDTIREGRLVALEVAGLSPAFTHVEVLVLPPPGQLPEGTLDRPWMESCEGCVDGTLGGRVTPAAGPCEVLLGHRLGALRVR